MLTKSRSTTLYNLVVLLSATRSSFSRYHHHSTFPFPVLASPTVLQQRRTIRSYIFCLLLHTIWFSTYRFRWTSTTPSCSLTRIDVPWPFCDDAPSPSGNQLWTMPTITLLLHSLAIINPACCHPPSSRPLSPCFCALELLFIENKTKKVPRQKTSRLSDSKSTRFLQLVFLSLCYQGGVR